jgi:excisionase family DNA binding protein
MGFCAMTNRYLSINDCAERLGVSRWTIAREIEVGALIAIPVRGTPRVDPNDFDDYLKRKKEEAAAAIADRKAVSAAPKRRPGRPRKAPVGSQQ